MERIFLILALICSLCLISCDDVHTEQPVIDLKGTWNILSKNNYVGEIVFTKNQTFTMTTERGNAYGDFSENVYSEHSFNIIYAEDENGEEILTEEDYENGGIVCKYAPENEKECQVYNLPYFRDEVVKIQKIK